MLRRAIFSAHAQTLPAAAHIIAYDTDRQGAPATRQRALDAVTPHYGWVAPLDDDDEFMPHHLEHLLRHAKDTGADMVYSWFELIGQGGVSYGDVDPIFPPTHYTNPFDPDDPIETTITVLVRAELAREVGYHALDRGGHNTGEDRSFTLGCVAAGAKISHLVERTWKWNHHGGNTSGLTTKGDWVVK